MEKRINKKLNRKKKQLSIRKKISGTSEKPRLAVFKSEKHIYAQIIDDKNGVTITSASTVDKDLKKDLEKTWNKNAAEKVGELLAKRALEKGISNVVFDRGGFKYHGRIKSLADSARKAGLKF